MPPTYSHLPGQESHTFIHTHEKGDKEVCTPMIVRECMFLCASVKVTRESEQCVHHLLGSIFKLLVLLWEVLGSWEDHPF